MFDAAAQQATDRHCVEVIWSRRVIGLDRFAAADNAHIFNKLDATIPGGDLNTALMGVRPSAGAADAARREN
jgi:hypothetical protein